MSARPSVRLFPTFPIRFAFASSSSSSSSHQLKFFFFSSAG
jgi:hypothetical protein